MDIHQIKECQQIFGHWNDALARARGIYQIRDRPFYFVENPNSQNNTEYIRNLIGEISPPERFYQMAYGTYGTYSRHPRHNRIITITDELD